MPKTATKTFSPLFALATCFRNAKGTINERELRNCGAIYTLATGGPVSKATNYAILEAIAPLIADGLVTTRTRTFAPKGCPGGRPRPALIDIGHLVLTPAGFEAIRPLFADVDAYRSEQAAEARRATIAEIAKLRRKLSAEAIAAAAANIANRDAANLDAADYDVLCRFARALSNAIPRPNAKTWADW